MEESDSPEVEVASQLHFRTIKRNGLSNIVEKAVSTLLVPEERLELSRI